jgi:hypothetical protein
MYIDPNTGGMLFQILAVLFGVFSGVVLIFSGKIRMFFARMTRRKHEQMAEETSSATDTDKELDPDRQP